MNDKKQELEIKKLELEIEILTMQIENYKKQTLFRGLE